MSASRQQTLQQERAANAWAAVEEVEQRYSKAKKEYGSLVRGLPALIQTDGLGQTLAFLKAKGKGEDANHHSIAYQHLNGWVMAQLGAKGDLLESLLQTDSATYRRATSEALAYLQWIKRFAEAKDWQSDGG